MVGTHRADIHRLDASHTPVVFYLQSREIAQGIGNGMGVQTLQLLTFQFLRRHYFLKRELAGDNHLVDSSYRILQITCDLLRPHICNNGA